MFFMNSVGDWTSTRTRWWHADGQSEIAHMLRNLSEIKATHVASRKKPPPLSGDSRIAKGAVLALRQSIARGRRCIPAISKILEDTILSGSSARLQAIEAVTTYHPTAAPLSFANISASELFGSNVFGK